MQFLAPALVDGTGPIGGIGCCLQPFDTLLTACLRQLFAQFGTGTEIFRLNDQTQIQHTESGRRTFDLRHAITQFGKQGGSRLVAVAGARVTTVVAGSIPQ